MCIRDSYPPPGPRSRIPEEPRKENHNHTVDGKKLRKIIDQASFAMDDTRLYLDTHPDDTAAIEYYAEIKDKYVQFMKKYLSIIAAVLLMGGFSSCSDFLDRYPLEELSDGSFWKTENDAEMAVSNLYNILPTWDVDEAINSDDAVHGIKWAAGNQSKGVYDPADYGWSGEYSYIRQANLILEKIQEMDLSEDAYKKLEGQARFFRAYIYFTLIRSFGAVPYIDKPLELTDVEDITRTPKDEVYAKVMEDFDVAIADLPVQWDDTNSGRVTKGAAMAMKARAALYYNNWETAMTEAKNVMDLGQYELYDKDNTGRYKELFWDCLLYTSPSPRDS